MLPRTIYLEGSPAEMGRQFGRLLRDEVHALAEERLRLSLVEAQAHGRSPDRAECLALAARMLRFQEGYAPEVHAEFMGIAEGAGIAPELLLIGNGYTDYKDVLAQGASATECTAFWVPAAATGGHALCGQTWDMHATAEPFAVLVHRRPSAGPATLSFTTAGCLSLIGVNAAGIAVGNTNLTPTDARPGVVYLAIIHRVLLSSTWEEAVRAVVGAPRASGHHYYLADAEGHAAGIETTASRSVVLDPCDDVYQHTNHYLAADLLDLAAPLDPESTTRERLSHISRLLERAERPLTPERLRALLASHDGPAPICVHNVAPDGAKSCGVAILSPETREMWVGVGNPCEGELHRVGLEDVA